MAFQYAVSLRIWHPSANPTDIVEQIGHRASAVGAAGEQRRTPKGLPLEGVYRETYCTFPIGEGEDGELAHFLENAAAELSHLKPVFDDLHATGGRVILDILWWTGPHGESFGPDLLSTIAALGIGIGITPISSD